MQTPSLSAEFSEPWLLAAKLSSYSVNYEAEYFMDNDQPITQWLDGLRHGDEESVRQIWESLFDRLMQVARQRLKSAKRSAYDEEDIVVSAFKSASQS